MPLLYRKVLEYTSQGRISSKNNYTRFKVPFQKIVSTWKVLVKRPLLIYNVIKLFSLRSDNADQNVVLNLFRAEKPLLLLA